MPQPTTTDFTTGARVAATAKARRRLRRSVQIERHHAMESAARQTVSKPGLGWRLLQSLASRTDPD